MLVLVKMMTIVVATMMAAIQHIHKQKERSHNERFGASGAVTRPKVCANLQVLRPSER
jgi:hypothetical protein